MSYSWDDLTSKSDIFYNVLPLTNEKGILEDNLSFRLTAKPKNSKYTFSASHTNGKRGRLEFSDNLVLENFHDTEIGIKLNNKPSCKLFAKLTDKLIPLDGSELNLEIESDGNNESANASFGYADKLVNLNLGFNYPLQQKFFDLSSGGNAEVDSDDEKPTPSFSFEFLFKPFNTPPRNRDIYVGAQGTLKTASEDTKSQYDLKGILATKTASFEGGLYVRKAHESEEKRQVGAWATSTDGESTISSHFSYDIGKNQFSYENFAGFQGKNDDRFFFGVQVVPKLVGSFGYERVINRNTKLNFGFAYALANKVETEKNSAFRFGLELIH